MDARQPPDEAAKRWAETHPAEAQQIDTVLRGSFASKECHQRGVRDVFVCPACFREFVKQVQVIEKRVAEEMEAGGLTWTRRWIEQVLT